MKTATLAIATMVAAGLGCLTGYMLGDGAAQSQIDAAERREFIALATAADSVIACRERAATAIKSEIAAINAETSCLVEQTRLAEKVAIANHDAARTAKESEAAIKDVAFDLDWTNEVMTHAVVGICAGTIKCKPQGPGKGYSLTGYEPPPHDRAAFYAERRAAEAKAERERREHCKESEDGGIRVCDR